MSIREAARTFGLQKSPERKRRYLRLSASSISILSAGVTCRSARPTLTSTVTGDAST